MQDNGLLIVSQAWADTIDAMQGDFVAALIDGVNQDLGRDVRDISVYSLNSALDTAVRASSAQHDDPDIIARLQIRLEESLGTETGG